MQEIYNTNPLRQFSFTVQDNQCLLENMLNEWQAEQRLPVPLTYLKAAKEEGGDTENVHYHIFVRGEKGERYSFYRDLFGVHLSDQKIYNVKQTIDYIGNSEFAYSDNHSDESKRGKKKGGTVHKVWEIGDIATVRIPRKGTGGNDLDARLEKIQDMVKAGCDVNELYEADFGVMVRYGKSIETYIAVHYGTAKLKMDVATLKESAKMREIDYKRENKTALIDMIFRLQDRIVNVENGGKIQ